MTTRQIIFLEPSCYSMFAEDYRELSLPGAAEVAARCILFEDFMENLLKQEPDALKFDREHGRVAIHAHCHAKALTNTKNALHLAARLPNRTVTMLDTGCCGMAGSFGMMESKYELSLKIAEPLVEQIKHQPYGTTLCSPAPVAGIKCGISPPSARCTWPKSSPKRYYKTVGHRHHQTWRLPAKILQSRSQFRKLKLKSRRQKLFWHTPLADQRERRFGTHQP